MRWLIPIYVMWMWTTVVTIELRCDYPSCFDEHVKSDESSLHYFDIKENTDETPLRHNIYIRYGDDSHFSLYCDEWHALDSSAMPNFTTQLNVVQVELTTCPPPATSSFVEAFSALNVTLQLTEQGVSFLKLKDLPSQGQLLAKHFNGLENLTSLFIGSSSQPLPIFDVGFLSTHLQNLRDLTIASLVLPPAELHHLLKLRSLTLITTTVEPLQKMLVIIPTHVRNLTLQYNKIEISEETIQYVAQTTHSVLENLWLVKWKEQRLEKMEVCYSLRLLQLKNPSVEELPDRWVAACPRLETLGVYDAENLSTLPKKLFEGATALKYLTISNGKLQSLPDGLFEGTPNLHVLDLSSNNLLTLSRALFAGLPLQSLSLAYNQLENEALESLEELTSLTKLNIGYNPSLHDLCEYNGYSKLQNLTQLWELTLQGLNITRVCRDWRENMKSLTHLDLSHTHITSSEVGAQPFKRGSTLLFVVVSSREITRSIILILTS